MKRVDTWSRLVAASLLLSVPAIAASQIADPAPAEPESEDIGFGDDNRPRMTVPISIGGRGPFQFLVDTGAERTVISAELARKLELDPGARTRMLTMTGVGDVSTVIIPSLSVSRRNVTGINAPALKAAHIGAAGILGIDSLHKQRIVFDFERQKMTVSPSRGAFSMPSDPDEIVVTARTRLGRLILVDASLNGQKLTVVLDTGSEVTIGNEALRAKLLSKGKMAASVPIELISVTGGKMWADYTSVKQVRLGGMRILDLPVAFAEVHPFRQLGLSDRPALLLGMDALRLFERVSVDFGDRKVRFLAPGLSGSAPPLTWPRGRGVRSKASRVCSTWIESALTVTLNLFQGPCFRPQRSSKMDAETSSA